MTFSLENVSSAPCILQLIDRCRSFIAFLVVLKNIWGMSGYPLSPFRPCLINHFQHIQTLVPSLISGKNISTTLRCLITVHIDRFRSDQNPPSPFPSLAFSFRRLTRALSLPFLTSLSRKKHLTKMISHPSNWIGLYAFFRLLL